LRSRPDERGTAGARSPAHDRRRRLDDREIARSLHRYCARDAVRAAVNARAPRGMTSERGAIHPVGGANDYRT